MFHFIAKSKIIVLIINFLLAFALLFSLSCEKRKHTNPLDPNHEGSGFPLPYDEVWDNLNYIIGLWLDAGWLKGYIDCPFEVESSTLKLNNEAIDLYWMYDEEDDFSFVQFNVYLDAEPGDEVSYELTINGKIFNGKIKMIYPVYGDFPDEFNSDKDFTFDWEIQKSPTTQICSFYIEDSDYDDDEKYWEIGASQRQFTIKKNNYLSNWKYVLVSIACFDYIYNKSNKFLLYSFSEAYKEYGEDDISNYITNNNIQQPLIEKALKSILKLK